MTVHCHWRYRTAFWRYNGGKLRVYICSVRPFSPCNLTALLTQLWLVSNTSFSDFTVLYCQKPVHFRVKIFTTRKYPLRGYILGLGATFISELRHLELLMGWNAEVWHRRRTNRSTDRREGGNSGLDVTYRNRANNGRGFNSKNYFLGLEVTI